MPLSAIKSCVVVLSFYIKIIKRRTLQVSRHSIKKDMFFCLGQIEIILVGARGEFLPLLPSLATRLYVHNTINIRRCLHEQETVIFFILSQMSKKIGYFWLSESYLELSNLLKNLFFTLLKVILASLTVRNNSSQGFPIFNIALVCLWSKRFIYFILYIFNYDALLFLKITHKQNRKLLGTNPVNQCAKFHPY